MRSQPARRLASPSGQRAARHRSPTLPLHSRSSHRVDPATAAGRYRSRDKGGHQIRAADGARIGAKRPRRAPVASSQWAFPCETGLGGSKLGTVA